jgi:DNA-binding transcriptional regulator YiaG
VEIDGQQYVACNGAGGRGYKIQTWMERCGYDIQEGSGKALEDFITDMEALIETLKLRIDVGRQRGGLDNTRRDLRGLQADPDSAVGTLLRAYIPADLEDRLRAQLAARAHIDACETDEETAPGWMCGSELRSARRHAGLRQKALADALGVSKMMVSHWEQGTRAIPTARMAEIEAILGASSGEKSKPEVTKSCEK